MTEIDSAKEKVLQCAARYVEAKRAFDEARGKDASTSLFAGLIDAGKLLCAAVDLLQDLEWAASPESDEPGELP